MSARFLLPFGVAAAVALSACSSTSTRDADTDQASAIEGNSNTDAAEVGGVCTTGFAGFSSQFLPNVQNEVCRGCHKGNNPNAPPWLAGQDTQIYLNAKNYVNFADLDNSRLVIRAGNLHCGGGCNEAMRARMKTYLTNWYNNGESSCDQTMTLRTQPVQVPANLPSDHFTTMSWDLSRVDVRLRGVSLMIEVRKFTDAAGPVPGSYVFRKPRFVSAQPISVAVSRVRILNNNSFQEAANQFERINTVASPDAAVATGAPLSYPLLSPEQMIVVEEHPGTDQLTVTFERLEPTTRRACRSMDTFNQKVMPIVQARSCLGCHAPGSTADPMALSRFDMSGGDQDLCAKFLARTWPNQDVLPALIQFPLFGRFEHPRVFVKAQDVLPDWTDWMQAEWQQ